MKNAYTLQKLTFIFLFALAATNLTAQNIFWSDSFDAPAGGTNNNNAGQGWTLNSGGNGANNWYINTPSQTIGCSSTGNMLHISCEGFLCGFLGGPNDPIYGAAASNNRSAVSPNISTLGVASPALSFEFICEGIPGEDYGLLAFSNDGGTTWNEFPERYEGVSTCSLITIPLTATYQNISNFKMRFRWIESNASNGLDPAFSVDNIKLSTNSTVCVPPTVSAGSAASICGGGSVTIGGTPTASGGTLTNYVYSWSPATGLSATNVANPTANPTTTTTYTVTVNGGDANCSASSTVTVTVGTAPTVSITPAGSTTICPGASVQLNATAGLSNYTWTTPTGTQTGASIQASAAGSYTLTAQNGTGCTGTSAPVTVTVQNVPNLTTTPSGSTNLCIGQNLPLTASNGFSNYSWTTPGGQVTGQTINASQAGTYTASATSGTCTVTAAPITVTAVSVPTLDVAPGSFVSLCPGQSVPLTASPGFSSYSWTTPAGSQSGSSVTASSPGTYSVSAQFGGCSVDGPDVTVAAVEVPSLSISSSTGAFSICPGVNLQLSASSGFSGYTWQTPGGVQSAASVNAAVAGTYSVTATILGCSVTSDPVTVNLVTIPSFTTTPSGNVSFCEGSSVNLNAANGFTGYSWTGPSGTVSGQQIAASQAGSYTANAVFQGCTVQAAPVVVTQGNAASIEITVLGSTVLCQGESVVLTAPAGYQNYQWSNGATGATTTVSTEQSITVSATSQGCSVTSEPVFISVSTPLPINASVSGSTDLCPGAVTELNASAGFTNYVWNGPTTTLNGQNVTVGEAGTYNVQATDINGCTSESNTITLTAVQTPALTVNPAGPVSICAGETATLTASAGFGNYLWNTPGGTVAGQSIEAGEEGNYTVQGVFSSCTITSSSVFVAVQSSPTLAVAVDGSTSVCIGESVTLTAEPGYSSYVWSNGATTQSIEVSVSGSYFVTAASNLGCDAVSNDVVISIIQPPTAAFSYDQVEPQNTVQFTYTGAYGNDFIWNFGGGVINNSENPLYQFPYEGTWPVTLIVSNECGADTFETEIEVIKIGFEDLDGISVDLLNDGNNWIVKGSAMGKEPLLLEVWSIDGRIMYSTTIQGNIINEQIGFSNYTSGIYMISLSRSGKRSVAKVIRR
jgi:hypothetical protein